MNEVEHVLPWTYLTVSFQLVPPVPMYLNFYMFNVTNAELVSNGTQTPKLVQVGPYVYDEYRTKDIRPDSTEDNDPYAIRYRFFY